MAKSFFHPTKPVEGNERGRHADGGTCGCNHPHVERLCMVVQIGGW